MVHRRSNRDPSKVLMIICSLRSKLYLTAKTGLIVIGRPQTSPLEMFWCSPTEQFICPPQTSQTSIRASFEHIRSLISLGLELAVIQDGRRNLNLLMKDMFFLFQREVNRKIVGCGYPMEKKILLGKKIWKS